MKDILKLRSVTPLLPLSLAVLIAVSSSYAAPPASDASTTIAPPAAAVEYRTGKGDRPIYRQPTATGALRGRLEGNEPFAVLEHVTGTGCKDWGRLASSGYTCLDGTVTTDAHPAPLPRMAKFDSPTPDEYFRYIATKRYDRLPAELSEALTPNIYGRPYRSWKGNTYASIAAWEKNAAPTGRLSRDRKHHFSQAVDTARGQVLVREDGSVVPVDDLYVYPVTRHHGRELSSDPMPEGLWPAWAIKYEGAQVHTAPSADSPVRALLPHHAPIAIKQQPADPTGHWWEIPDGLGAGVPGYVEDTENIRHPAPRADRPSGIADDEVWVDVDLAQQVLHVMRGDTLTYVTMVATGKEGHSTPKGTYRLMSKAVGWDMASRPNAAEAYYVEDVPWTMHFRPMYALHGAYWHWGFGRVASHGCVNLAPIDAKYVFDHASPALPEGWREVYPTAEDPGTVIRVRLGDAAVPDKRGAFNKGDEPVDLGPLVGDSTEPPG